jgi:hypothetical protein
MATTGTDHKNTDKNTVKPALTRKRGKRAKRVVENPEYAAFARRVLRGYARRIAAGDIEALPSMVLFVSDVDAALREAVQGLRRFGYSWGEISARLGVTRQAVQSRYGDPRERGVLDARLLDARTAITLDTLVAVFADHCRGVPATFTCPGCGYVFDESDVDGDCPTNQVVRPLLQQRRRERPSALRVLTPPQLDELEAKRRTRNNSNGNGVTAAARADVVADELFDVEQFRRTIRPGLDPVPHRRTR